MKRLASGIVCLGIASGCGSDATPATGAGGGGMASSHAGVAGQGGSVAGSAGSGASPAAGGTASAGGGAAGSGGAPAPHPPAMGTPGVWEEVTSPDMDPELFTGGEFGVGNIVADPARPTDLYVGGYGSIWKSVNYGLTWSELDSQPNPPYLALGHVLAVAGTTPATLWMANVNGAEHVFRSRDGGLTFALTGTIPEQPDAASLYSIVVDPGNADHLISGLHEADKVLESTDAGDSWHFVSGAGWPTGGKSWFPFFVDTGDTATTSKTWLAIAQDGGSAVMTSDAGATWAEPAGLAGLQHPHGSSGLFQRGQTLFIAGIHGPVGDGVYRSQDLGASWTRVAEGSGGIVWGSEKSVHAMWGWACGGCGLDEGGPQYQTAAQPGDTWAPGVVPEALDWGPNSVAVTSDGDHAVFVGSMWATGLWRYVEP